MSSDSGLAVQAGLFVGLATLDCVYQVAALPQPNQKVVAIADTLAAGGPATNAAVTFAHLGDRPTLLAVFGQHPLSPLLQADLVEQGVQWIDLAPEQVLPPPVSSILVTQATGDRAVVSRNATQTQVGGDRLPAVIHDALTQRTLGVVLIDGHQPALSATLARLAHAQQIPVVLDGGSWKPGLEAVLPWVDYALCSANFCPPGCSDEDGAIAHLRQFAIPHIAITHGGDPIHIMHDQGTEAWLPVPSITPVDTLGAGDVFHGAFCHFILRLPFKAALAAAASVAARSCQSFGTRQWLHAAPPD